MTTMEEAVKKASIFVTATGCCHILRPEHFKEMRNDSILANIGHFDIEINVAWLNENCKKVTIKPQVCTECIESSVFDHSMDDCL